MKTKTLALLALTLCSYLSATTYLESTTPPMEPQTELEQLTVIMVKYGNNPDRISVLHYAILQNDAFAIDLLLKYGASLNKKSFYYAILAGNIELVDKLLRLQLDSTLGDSTSIEPLKIAIQQHQNKIAKLIIDSGIDLHKHSHPSDDYLYECCRSGNSEVFVYLMEQGAKPVTNDYSEYFRILTANFEDKAQEKHLVKGKIEILKHLDTRNVLKIDLKNIIAFTHIYPEALQYLLDWRFIQPNMQSNNRPILFNVVWNEACKLELTKILFDYGVDVNAKDSFGRNVLFELTRQSLVNKKQKDIIILLVDHGADLNAKDNQCKTTLDFVTDKNMREFLISLGAK